MRGFIWTVLAVGMALWMTGCSSGSKKLGSIGSDVEPLAYTLRSYHVGERWQYSLAGGLQHSDGAYEAISGSLNVSIAQVPAFHGQPVFGRVADLMLYSSLGTQSFTSTTTYYLQDQLTRNVIEYGYATENAEHELSSSVMSMPGAWDSTLDSTIRYRYIDGTIVTDTLTVTGTEVVETPIGNYWTWKTHYTSKTGDRITEDSVIWFAPQIGQSLKRESNFYPAPGETLHLTIILLDTSVE